MWVFVGINPSLASSHQLAMSPLRSVPISDLQRSWGFFSLCLEAVEGEISFSFILLRHGRILVTVLQLNIFVIREQSQDAVKVWQCNALRSHKIGNEITMFEMSGARAIAHTKNNQKFIRSHSGSQTQHYDPFFNCKRWYEPRSPFTLSFGTKFWLPYREVPWLEMDYQQVSLHFSFSCHK